MGTEVGFDGGQHLGAQAVLFEQVAKPQDGVLIGQSGGASIELGELPVHGNIVQGLFHGRVAQSKPLLHEVNAQHGRYGKGRAHCLARRRVGLNQANQLRPWNHQVHLVKKLTLARSLGYKFKSGAGKAHLFHGLTNSDSGCVRGSFADVP